jgi:hypothetical protein
MASMAVRATLLNTSWAARDQPEVWVWARRESDRESFGSNSCFMSLAQSRRAARCLATSMNMSMPAHQKNDRRGANWSTVMPAATPARTYSMPSARV